MTAIEIYNTLGRKSRLALADRSASELADTFDGLCDDCKGTGRVPNTPTGAACLCPSCAGRGKYRVVAAEISNRVLQLCDRYASKVRK